MKFCTNCGEENKSKSKFCENCGKEIPNSDVISLGNTTKNSKINKTNNIFNGNRKLFYLIGILLIMGIFYFFNSESSGLKNKEDKNLYKKAVEYVEKGDFIEAKLELEKIKKPNKKIKDDIELTLQLFGLKKFYITDDATEDTAFESTSKLLDKIDEKFKNHNSELRKASDGFLNESREYLKFLKLYLEAEKLFENNNMDKAKEKIEEMKKFEFSTPSIKEVVGRKFENLDSKKSVLEQQSSLNNTDNDNEKEQTQKNDDLDGIDKEYEKWSSELKKHHPNIKIYKEDGRWFVNLEGNRYAVIYDSPGLVRLVNATSNVFVEY